jgi:hypothetical protein
MTWRSPLARYSLLALIGGLWTFGLVDHHYASAGTMKYLLMSLLIGAMATI